MSESGNVAVTMAVDTKKYGIRIHKALFRQLGEPRYIQLLVNPDDGVVAIQTVEKEMSGGQTHRIVEKRMHSENSYEIYSRPFIRKAAGSGAGDRRRRRVSAHRQCHPVAEGCCLLP